MEAPTYPCPQCGRRVSPETIICPYCQSSIVIAAGYEPTPLGPFVPVPTGQAQPRRPPFAIMGGLLAATLAATGLIGLGFWLNQVNGEAAGVLISSDFLLVPLVMGLLCAFFWRNLSLTTVEYFLYALVNSALGLAVAAVFMHEGVICLVIVSPLLLSFVFVGSLLGRWLFSLRNNRLNLSLVPLALAVLAWDALTPHHYENSVSDTLVIHAPPAQVWAHLAAVPPIPDRPDYWLFRMGLPYPTQATVMGGGVGARRRCVFSHNDVFEECITEWQPKHRLTFDVTSQPRDPEILGHARVLRGQFLLHDNGDGTTTLTGTSWYELYVYPSWYYDIWARSIARQVHVRVMRHIKALSEQEH